MYTTTLHLDGAIEEASILNDLFSQDAWEDDYYTDESSSSDLDHSF